MKKESTPKPETESTQVSKTESTPKPPQKDFIKQIADALLLKLKANTDPLSMSYKLALKAYPGSISLRELRKILVLAGIREIKIENATIKTIN